MKWAIGAVIAAAVVIAVAVVFGGGERVSDQLANAVSSVDAITGSDWVRGAATSTVTLVEYGDFQCPACAAYHPIVTALFEEFGDRIAFTHRHFPLRATHPNAEQASRAAEAAGLLGKFWEMHNILYERQAEWASLRNPKSTLIGYAKEIGIDAKAFEAALGSDAVADEVQKDVSGAYVAGVNATPTFFLNGERVQPRSAEEFRILIEAALL